MILKIRRIRKQPYPTYQGHLYSQLLITGAGTSPFFTACVVAQNYKLQFIDNPQKGIEGNRIVTPVVDLMEGNFRAGYIYPFKRKNRFLRPPGYRCIIIGIGDSVYTVYKANSETSLPCFYVFSEEKMMSVIQEVSDGYDIYALDLRHLFTMSVLAIYLDQIGTCHSGKAPAPVLLKLSPRDVKKMCDLSFVAKAAEQSFA